MPNRTVPTLEELLTLNKVQQTLRLTEVNQHLESLTAQERVVWGLENLQGNHALSSSFGIQAAVMLHLLTSVKSDIPVVLTDTGYLFPETYQFIDELTERLNLNLKFTPRLYQRLGKKLATENCGNKVLKESNATTRLIK